MTTRNRIAVLVAAVAVWLAPVAGRAQDEEALERQIAALQASACQVQPQLCEDLKAFADAGAPCIPEGKRLTVGHAYLIEDGGAAEAVEYLALRTQRAAEITLVQTQHVFSENEDEKTAAEALVAGLASGKADPANPLLRYLARSGEQVPQLLAQPEARSLVVRAEGPVLYLRQTGNWIYAASPDAVITRPDSGSRRAGLMFAVLPAFAPCAPAQ